MGLEPTTLPGVTWTDDPIVAGVTDVKAAHLTELRDAVNAARVAHGLSAATWTDATVMAGVTVIQAVHIAELRAAINAVYTAAGATPPAYTDPVLVPGVTDIRAVHLTELRAARANAPAAEVTAARYYHLDALGSVRAVTDAAGATVRRHDYAAFGEAPAPGLGADARRFTGKERDAETGLDYFSARYYGAPTGRFTTPDPGHIGGDIFDPQSWNAYAYARNNPLRFVDPTGTEYYVTAEGGQAYWFEGSWGAFGTHAAGFKLDGDAFGGVIRDATGRQVGTYKYYNLLARLLVEIGDRSRPAEYLARAGVLFTGGAAAVSAGAVGPGAGAGRDGHSGRAPDGTAGRAGERAGGDRGDTVLPSGRAGVGAGGDGRGGGHGAAPRLRGVWRGADARPGRRCAAVYREGAGGRVTAPVPSGSGRPLPPDSGPPRAPELPLPTICCYPPPTYTNGLMF